MSMFKNIVIISVDSLRVDGINYNRDLIYGKGKHKPIKTPNLDEFARKGTTFLNAYSTNTYTTSAHASLFTGEYPPVHGIRAFFDFNQKLNPKTKTIAEELNEKGYQTFFYSDIKELFSEMDIWRGFKIKTYENSNWLWESVSDFKKDKNFIFIHLFDIHEPYLFIEDKAEDKKINEDYYDSITEIRKKLNIKSKINQKKNPHDSFDEIRNFLFKKNLDHKKYLSEYYFKGIEKFDKIRFPKILGNLDKLGFKNKNTLFIILSDHGEGKTEFFNSLNFNHGGEITEEVIRITLMINTKFKTVKKEQLISIKDLKKFLTQKNFLISKKNPIIYAERYVSDIKPKNTKKLFKLFKSNTLHFLHQRAFIDNKEKIIIYGFLDHFIKNKKEKVNKKNISFLITSFFNRLPLNKEEIKFYLKNYEDKNFDFFLKDLWNKFKNKLNFISIFTKNKLNEKLTFCNNDLDKYCKIIEEYEKKYQNSL